MMRPCTGTIVPDVLIDGQGWYFETCEDYVQFYNRYREMSGRKGVKFPNKDATRRRLEAEEQARIVTQRNGRVRQEALPLHWTGQGYSGRDRRGASDEDGRMEARTRV